MKGKSGQHGEKGTIPRSVHAQTLFINSYKYSNSNKKVFLVGGLGLSMYLQNRIEKRLASEYENIELFNTRGFM